jgi:hypothetical protein
MKTGFHDHEDKHSNITQKLLAGCRLFKEAFWPTQQRFN